MITLKLGQTFTLPHIQNRCWGRNFRSRPTGRTENWPTSTCHMSPWQSSSIIFKLLSISSVHDKMQVFNTSLSVRYHVTSSIIMVSVISYCISENIIESFYFILKPGRPGMFIFQNSLFFWIFLDFCFQ